MKKVSLPDYWWDQIVETLEGIAGDSHGMTIADRISQEIKSQIGEK